MLGIILYAVAAKKTLADPSEPLSEAGRWALRLGIAFFLCGFVLARYRVVRRIAWERIAAAAAALVVALTLDGTDALATLAVTIAILVVAISVETARLGEICASFRTG